MFGHFFLNQTARNVAVGISGLRNPHCASVLSQWIFQILLIVLSLAADAVIGNVQEKAMKQYGANQVEMVLYSYSLGTVYLFFGQVASGNFMPATRKRLKSFFTVRLFYNFRISSTTHEFNQQVLLELTMNFS